VIFALPPVLAVNPGGNGIHRGAQVQDKGQLKSSLFWANSKVKCFSDMRGLFLGYHGG